jgi:hypothetical protein
LLIPAGLIELSARGVTAQSATHVRFGSKADIAAYSINVRLTPKSGHWNSFVKCPLCAKLGNEGRANCKPLVHDKI